MPNVIRSRDRRLFTWALATVLLALLVGKAQTFSGWDQTFYMGQTSSLIEDGDLDLRNDALFSDLEPSELVRLLTAVRADGSVANTFSIGPALLWMPAYIVALHWNRADDPVPPRWNRWQVVALYLTSVGLAFGLIWILDRWLRRLGLSRSLAALVVMALILGSPLLIYAFRDYTTSHLLSALTVSMLPAVALLLARRPTVATAMLSGVAVGLAFLCRWQEIVTALILLIPLLQLKRRGTTWSRLLTLTATIALSALTVASLQLHAWWLERGEIFSAPQHEGYLRLHAPQMGSFLFSGLSGLFSWSPVYLLGLLGLLLPWRCRIAKQWRWAALTLLVVAIYVNASVTDWWAGVSYGSRRMSSALPLVALGVANLLLQRRWRVVTITLLALCCLWGGVTSNLYIHSVRDLSLVFQSRPSVAPGAEREIVAQSSPEEARRIATRFPFGYRRLNLFSDQANAGQRVASVLLLGSWLLVAAMILRRVRADPGLTAVLVAVLLISLTANLRLSVGPSSDPTERHLWGEVARAARYPIGNLGELEPQVGSEIERGNDSRTDAWRSLWLLALMRSGRASDAEPILDGLATRPYPVFSSWGRWFHSKQTPGHRVVTHFAGTFFRSEQQSDWVARIERDNGRPARVLDIEFDLTGVELAATEGASILRLTGRRRKPVVQLSVTGNQTLLLSTAAEKAQAPFLWTDDGTVRLRVRWLPRPARVEVEAGSASTIVLRAALSRKVARTTDLLVVFGDRDPSRFPEAAFSNLWVEQY